MKLKKIRNALLVVLTLALVSATTVAITWAASHAALTGKENNFTNNPNIDLQFQEPTFDSLTWTEDRNPSATNEGVPNTGTLTTNAPVLPDGTTTITDPTKLGYNLAKSYTAGQYIPKNPQLKNSTKNHNLVDSETNVNNNTTSDEWVALKVRYLLKVSTNDFELESYTATDPNPNEYNDGSVTSKAYKVENPSEDYWIDLGAYSNFSTLLATVRHGNSATMDDENTQIGFRVAASPAKDDNMWRDISGTGNVFMYDNILHCANGTNPGDSTTPLFDFVKINESNAFNKKWVTVKDSTNNTYSTSSQVYMLTVSGTNGNETITNRELFFSALPEFKIELTGYAVQADNVYYPGTQNQTVFADNVLNGFIASMN